MSCTYVRTYVCMLHDVRISCALHCLVHGVSMMEFETQLNAMHICILIGMSTVYTYIHVYVYMHMCRQWPSNDSWYTGIKVKFSLITL